MVKEKGNAVYVAKVVITLLNARKRPKIRMIQRRKEKKSRILPPPTQKSAVKNQKIYTMSGTETGREYNSDYKPYDITFATVGEVCFATVE